MALNAYMTLKGETQGDIKGSVTQSGREDSVLIIEMDHEIYSPRDAATGLPTGKRVHKPLVCRKEVDKSSPLLASSLVNNENLQEVVFKFWRPSSKGAEEHFYTIALTNAAICSIKLHLPNTRDKATQHLREQEEIAFSYQKISWTYEDGGISAEDDWEAPVV